MTQRSNGFVDRVRSDDSLTPNAIEQFRNPHDLAGPFGQKHQESHRAGIELRDAAVSRDLTDVRTDSPVPDLPKSARELVHRLSPHLKWRKPFF
jgi:hypothetical protein